MCVIHFEDCVTRLPVFPFSLYIRFLITHVRELLVTYFLGH